MRLYGGILSDGGGYTQYRVIQLNVDLVCHTDEGHILTPDRRLLKMRRRGCECNGRGGSLYGVIEKDITRRGRARVLINYVRPVDRLKELLIVCRVGNVCGRRVPGHIDQKDIKVA